MTTENRLASLRDKHAKLDAEIRSLEASPGADALQVGELKRKKLLLKDEIELHERA